ncbi:glutamate-tRNA ligase [Sphaceloma murrayae]|uniref:Glutamate-tRNA ligase n=1 Tax=Sphaceloma murrayae TaxID=2082308 RepID=A0A2K1QRL7_9PEZI|nr:glutamate-tRNA ligase [Sphaceloma murrayae]
MSVVSPGLRSPTYKSCRDTSIGKRFQGTSLDLLRRRKRTVEGAEQRLYEDLKWAGLDWDEGPGVGGKYKPYNQSSRKELYDYYAKHLLGSGYAYRCFCPSSQQQGSIAEPTEIGAKIGGCPSDCKSLSETEVSELMHSKRPFVIRFRSQQNPIVWNDLVYGAIKMKADSGSKMFNSIADTILMKSDGSPTYHLANVVDDHDMKITHVIRGTEWMSSTALHVALYEAFRWNPPTFAHVSLLTDEGHNKLSKRNFDVDVASLVSKFGLLPEALVNYLVLLGWSNPTKMDVKTVEELVDIFDLKFTKGDTVVTMEKLFFLQKQHARRRIMAAATNADQTNQLDLLVDYLQRPAKVSAWDPTTRDEILGGRDVRLYLQSILLIDSGTYETPRRYLDENNYFFKRAKPRNARPENGSTETMKGGQENFDPRDAHISDDGETLTFMASTAKPISLRDLELTYPAEVKQMVEEIVKNDKVKETLSLWHDPAKSLPDNARDLHDIIAGAATTCQNILHGLLIRYVARVRDEAGLTSEGETSEMKKTPEYKTMAVDFHKYLRSLLSGRSKAGPSTFRVMAVLGYEESRRRIEEQMEALS